MKKVYLHGSLGEKFGRVWTLSAKTIPEIVWAIECNQSGFIDYTIRLKQKNMDYMFLKKKPSEIKVDSDPSDIFFERKYINKKIECEEIHLVPTTQGGGLITGLAAAFTAIGVTAPGLATFLAWTTVAVAAQFAINALFKPPKPPARGTPTTTKSLLISATKNNKSQGIPVPIGYGRLKVGSATIDSKRESHFLKSSNSSSALESYSNIEYIDLLSEGPIEGFVNQNGGAIVDADIQEGIYLNNVAIRNIKYSAEDEDVFNYVLTENDEKPEFKNGSESEKIVLSPEISSLFEKEHLLLGPKPYVGDSEKAEYDDHESAIKAGAQPSSHTISNANVNKIILSFKTELSQNNDDGTNEANSCRFMVLTSKNGSDYNLFDQPAGVLSMEFIPRGQKNKQRFNIREALSEQYIESITAQNIDISEQEIEDYKHVLRELEKAKNQSKPNVRMGFIIKQIVDKLDLKPPNVSNDQWNTYIKFKDTGLEDRNFNNELKPVVEYINSQISGESNTGLRVDNFGFFIIEGIATSAYEFDIEIEFSNSGVVDNYQNHIFKVVKLSSEYDPTVKGGDIGGLNKARRLQLSSVQERISAPMVYPHSAMCRIMFDSRNFKSTPDRSYHLKLKKVLIPSNYDPISRTYDGPWDGLFKGQKESEESINYIPDSEKYWTDNPAWIFFDLVQNPRYGLGKYGLEEYNIDKWQLYKASRYCDELVETGYPVETSSGFPRPFKTLNTLQNQEGDSDAGSFTIKILNENWYIDQDGNEVYINGYSESLFKEEFGDKKSFTGKKIAFFVYQHEYGDGAKNNEQKLQLKKRSALRTTKYKIYERVIKRSNSTDRTVTLFGPTFENDAAAFQDGNKKAVIGACCTQRNYPIVEPRFTCSAYLNEKAEALNIMNNLASVFRGLVGYNFGKIFTMQDSKKNPIMLFNNSNVDKKTGFRYSSFEKNKKFTSSMVRFINKDKSFAPDLVHEEDSDSMRLFGHQPRETMGFGITSESQARRLAKWVLFTSQLETEKISFIAGEEAAYLYPSAVFEVSDENRAGSAMSGRILRIENDSDGRSSILIDKSIEDIVAVDQVELTVNVGLPFMNEELISKRAPFHKSAEDQDVEIDSYSAPQIYKFQASITELFFKKSGPQGQRTYLTDIMFKVPFTIDLSSNLFKSFNHGLEDGDRIRFTSVGSLPYGLSKKRIGISSYYVVQSSEHTFKVSTSLDGDEVFIFDEGRDRLGNAGGMHYACIENTSQSLIEKNQEKIDQIEIASAYSIQGLYGIESSGVAVDVAEDLGNLFIVSFEGSSGWYYSSMFGFIFVKGEGSWVFSLNLGWIFVKEMNFSRSSDDEFFWFWLQGLGWVGTSQNLYNKYWYFSSIEKWCYVFYEVDPDSKKDILTGELYVFHNQHGKSVGDEIYFSGESGAPSNVDSGTKRFYVSQVFTSSGENQNGYMIVPYEKKDQPITNLVSAPEPNSEILEQQQKQSNPGYQSSAIFEIKLVDYLDSKQSKGAVRLVMNEGHGLDFSRNTNIGIVGFSSDSVHITQEMNTTWDIIRISENEIELIDSELQYIGLSASVVITNNGNVEYIESIKNLSIRSFQSQLFRVLGVKEVDDRKYEVSGIEYNLSKFDSIDKNLNITFPSVPIPPQADMSLPEAPRNLLLTDLTN